MPKARRSFTSLYGYYYNGILSEMFENVDFLILWTFLEVVSYLRDFAYTP